MKEKVFECYYKESDLIYYSKDEKNYKEIKWIDIETFEPINSILFTDKNWLYQIYNNEYLIENGNLENNEVLINHNSYEKIDSIKELWKNKIYDIELGKIIKLEWIDWISSYSIDWDNNYIKDDYWVYYIYWWDVSILNWIDKESVDFFDEEHCFLIDKNWIYEINWKDFKKLDFIDIKTFKVIDFCYSKDKNNVYHVLDWNFTILEWIDVKTIKVIDYSEIKDKNNNYYISDEWEIEVI